MSQSKYREAVVVLRPGSLEAYQDVSEHVRDEPAPSWMLSKDTVLHIAFDNSHFTQVLDNITLVHGERRPPPVDVFLKDNRGKPSFIKGGIINGWWPSMVTIMGEVHLGQPRVIVPNLISVDKKEEMRLEAELNEKVKQEPDLGRFRIIDWED